MAFVNGNFFSYTPVSLIVFAIISALGYDAVRKISTNMFVPVVLGLILIFIGKGGVLSTVGAGISALGISRFIAKETQTVITSS